MTRTSRRQLRRMAACMAVLSGCRAVPGAAIVRHAALAPAAAVAARASQRPVASDPGSSPPAVPAPAAIVRSPAGAAAVSSLAGDGNVFSEPDGLAAQSDGTVAVADHGSLSIWRIAAGGQVSVLAGGTFGRQDGTGTAAQFWSASDVAAAPDGSLVVADGDRLRRVSSAGVVTTIALRGPDGQDVPYVEIFGVAVEPDGSIDLSTLHRIDRLGPDGVVRTLAGSGQAGFADGAGNLAAFDVPYHLAWDPAGWLVVTDSGNDRIRRVNLDGSVTTIAGSGAAGFTDGPVGTAQFNAPVGVAAQADGTLWVADGGNAALREIADGQVRTAAGTGVPGFADGPPAQAQFGAMTAIAALAGGGEAIADPDNRRIRVLR